MAVAAQNQVWQGVPPGTMIWSARSSAPAGYIAADGSNQSRPGTQQLFDAIGTQFGTGDGSTTFGLPDGRDRKPIGKGTSFSTLGGTGGGQTVTISTSNLPSHTHGLGVFQSGNTGVAQVGGGSQLGTATTDATGSGAALNVMNPYITLNCYIAT